MNTPSQVPPGSHPKGSAVDEQRQTLTLMKGDGVRTRAGGMPGCSCVRVRSWAQGSQEFSGPDQDHQPTSGPQTPLAVGSKATGLGPRRPTSWEAKLEGKIMEERGDAFHEGRGPRSVWVRDNLWTQPRPRPPSLVLKWVRIVTRWGCQVFQLPLWLRPNEEWFPRLSLGVRVGRRGARAHPAKTLPSPQPAVTQRRNRGSQKRVQSERGGPGRETGSW